MVDQILRDPMICRKCWLKRHPTYSTTIALAMTYNIDSVKENSAAPTEQDTEVIVEKNNASTSTSLAHNTSINKPEFKERLKIRESPSQDPIPEKNQGPSIPILEPAKAEERIFYVDSSKQHQNQLDCLSLAGGDRETKTLKNIHGFQDNTGETNNTTMSGLQEVSSAVVLPSHSCSENAIIRDMTSRYTPFPDENWLVKIILLLLFILTAWGWLEDVELKIHLSLVEQKLNENIGLINELESEINITKDRLGAIDISRHTFEELLNGTLYLLKQVTKKCSPESDRIITQWFEETIFKPSSILSWILVKNETVRN